MVLWVLWVTRLCALDRNETKNSTYSPRRSSTAPSAVPVVRAPLLATRSPGSASPAMPSGAECVHPGGARAGGSVISGRSARPFTLPRPRGRPEVGAPAVLTRCRGGSKPPSTRGASLRTRLNLHGGAQKKRKRRLRRSGFLGSHDLFRLLLLPLSSACLTGAAPVPRRYVAGSARAPDVPRFLGRPAFAFFQFLDVLFSGAGVLQACRCFRSRAAACAPELPAFAAERPSV